MAETAPAVSVEKRGAVLWMRLQRPEALNAVNREVADGIDAALDRAGRADIRALVICGTGRAFCAGADLHELPGETIDIDVLETAVHRVDEVVDRLAAFSKPVVAGVNGLAVAGGLELVLACDVVIAAQSARLGDAHVNYGLLPGAGGSYRLPARVGVSMAKRLMLTGEFVAADELVSTGLITRVVPDDALESALDDVSSALSRRSPRVLAAMKRLVDGSRCIPPENAAEAEKATLSDHLRSPDVIEGLTAFREGRKPVFDDDPVSLSAATRSSGAGAR